MLRISPSKAGAEAVKKYFIHPSSQEAYYSEGQDFNGIWGGKGAARLGLSGSLQEGAFSRLCDNLHPLTGEKLTLRMKENRRVGYDVNFHVPKSVSLAYFYSGDERILQRIRQAAHETMLDMQERAGARVRKDGCDEDRTTGELTWAEFVHKTARPVNGFPDPLIHVHCYVFNATFDETEGAWKALQFGDVKIEADSYEKAFHARLATYLKELGLQIENNKYAFEIGGVSRGLRDKFSRRTAVIEAEAARRGITDAEEKAKLGALTRERKIQDVPMSELEPIWWARLSPEEKQALESIKAQLAKTRSCVTAVDIPQSAQRVSKELGSRLAVSGQSGIAPCVKVPSGHGAVSMNRATWPVEKPKVVVEPTDEDRKAVAFAVEHLFERQSVVTERQLIGEAFKNWNYGQATLEGVTEAIRQWPLVRKERKGRMMMTTAEVLAEESRIADACLFGRGKSEAMNPFWGIRDEELTAEQKNAVCHVLNSQDFITGIAGNPGVGKTRILQEVKRGIEGGCHKLLVLAPWGVTVHEVLRKEGFENAETVAKLLMSEELQKQARGAVLLVDEAGLLSAREADRLIALAQKLEARLVMVGDVGQHHAVERGQAFDHLQKQGRMQVAEVKEIQRQKGSYKRVVELVLQRRTDEAIELLQETGKVFEMSLEERKVALAKDYVAAIAAGESALVVAPTHAECNNVTEGIRATLKAKGVIKQGVEWEVLPNLSWTEAQKSDCRLYTKGLVAQINAHVKGFALGEQLEVIGVSDGMVRVRSRCSLKDGIKALPLGTPDAFSVHERQTMEICEGDRLRVTANGRTEDRHPLKNGSVYAVDHISHDGKIVLENGWRLNRDFKHLEYGYTLTSHAAQGKTVDRVFLAQSPELSAGASDLTQFLVSITRGREDVKMYTTDLELLRENISQVRERLMATELLHGRTEENAREAELAGISIQLGSQAETILEQVSHLVKPLNRESVRETAKVAEWLGTQKEISHAVEWVPEAEAAAAPEQEEERKPKRAIELELDL